jgi:ATP-dependent 26S proteasome regulatory subunit
MQESHVLELQMKINGLEKELAQVRRENAQLKRIPLFIAAVVAVMEGGEVHLRQQGNNQEYISQVNDELSKILKPGTRVAVNNALSIVKIIDEPWMPLFIATVVKAMKNREVYLRRQGDSLAPKWRRSSTKP